MLFLNTKYFNNCNINIFIVKVNGYPYDLCFIASFVAFIKYFIFSGSIAL